MAHISDCATLDFTNLQAFFFTGESCRSDEILVRNLAISLNSIQSLSFSIHYVHLAIVVANYSTGCQGKLTSPFHPAVLADSINCNQIF